MADKEDKEEIQKENEVQEEKVIDDIDRANLAAEALERANDRKQKLLDREEKLLIENKLGGRSDGGEKKESKEDKLKKGAKALLPEGLECPGVTD